MSKRKPDQKETISFRIESGKIHVLDNIAKTMDRDRSYILNEAIDQYLAIYQWQIGHIHEGLQQARQGNLTPHEEVVKKWEMKLARALDATRRE